MEKPQYKIMDALLLAQEGGSDAPSNYVTSNEFSMTPEEQAKMKKLEENRKRAEASGEYKGDISPEEAKTHGESFKQEKINIQGYLKDGEEEKKPEVSPELQPEQAPVKPKVEALMPLITPDPEVADQEEKVLEQSTEEGLRSAAGFTDEYPNFWVGAAPMLMGALLGDLGAGAKQGGDALIQRYKDERDASQASWKANRKLASEGASKKYQAKKYKDSQGKMRWGNYDPSTGNFIKDETKDTLADLGYEEKVDTRARTKEKYDIRAGKHQTRFKNERNGKDMIWDKRTNLISELGAPETSLGGNQLSAVKKIKDQVYKERPASEKYRKMASSVRGFTSNDPERQRIAFKNMAKALEGGKLSDFDMLYLQDTFSLFDTWKTRFGQQFTSGKLDSEKRRLFASEMAKAMEKDKKLMQERYNQYYSDGSMVGLSPEEMRGYVGVPIGMYDKVVYKDKSGVTKRADISQLDNVVNAKFEVLDYE